MENQNNLEEFLHKHLLHENADIETPSIQLMHKARQKVLLHKKESNELNDLFSLFAMFLNVKIKLYHAVIASILISVFIIFMNNKKENPSKNEARSEHYVSNIAAVKNSTVLSSINTFVSYK